MKTIKIYFYMVLATMATVLYVNADKAKTRSNMPLMACILSCHRQDDHVWADMTFTNSTEATVTVFEGGLLKGEELDKGASFRVKRGDISVPYTGILIKRLPPRVDEFYSMKPHEIIKAKVDLSKYFDFTLPGKYTIRYSCITETLPRSSNNLIKIESNEVSIVLKH